MEEDIKILEKYINNLFKFDCREILEKEEIVKVIDYKEIQAIENLLKRYKELEEENKKLEKSYKIEKLKNVLDEESLKEALEEMEKNYIPISVIQNKIDELEKAGTTKTLNNKNELIEEHYFLQDEIEVLQELLEERNK